MVERKPSITFKKEIKANLGALWHQAARCFTEAPLGLRALRAPEGELVRGDAVRAKGRIVRYSGETYVILTEEDVMVFPNKKAGDVIRPLPHK